MYDLEKQRKSIENKVKELSDLYEVELCRDDIWVTVCGIRIIKLSPNADKGKINLSCGATVELELVESIIEALKEME